MRALAIMYYLFMALVILMAVLIFNGCSHGSGIPACEFDSSCDLQDGPTAEEIEMFRDDDLPDGVIQPPKKHRKKK